MFYLRLLILRLAICVTASAGLIVILTQVHDYSQTRQAYFDYLNGDGLVWVIGFYFINEAGSGIKYAITGNERHLGYFPRSDIVTAAGDPERSYREATVGAAAGDWQAQLQVSHFHAIGWGRAVDNEQAKNWYLRSEARARALGEHSSWENSGRRKRVRVIIADDLSMQRLADQLPEPYQANPARDNKIQLLPGG